MREKLARIAVDLRDLLRAEAELPSGAHLLVPRAAPRKPPGVASLERIAAEVNACTLCGLSASRRHAVPGEGSAQAPLMLIGEAPGFYEDQQGQPFVGAAGRFLDELLGSIGLDRRKVYICNVIKCRPPGNRDPLPQEIEACRKWLDRQIEIIDPRMIVTLGRHSMARFFPAGVSIGKIHGTAQDINGRICFAMYHPTAALHQQSLRKTIETDILKLPGLLSQVEKAPKTEPESKQLSMF